MPKKSEKNENRRRSLRKVQGCPKKKAKATPKQKAAKATPKQKAAKATPKEWVNEAYEGVADWTIDQEIAWCQEQAKRNHELRCQMNKEKNEKTVETFLSIGYIFSPEEGKLLDYFLKNKVMDGAMDFCPIREADVYANHPQALTGKSEVGYFFTRSRPNEIQPGSDVEGNWIIGEKEDVFYQDEKVGVKQVVEYFEAGHKSEYKIIEYQLDPAPDYMKAGLWYVCKLCNGGSCVDVRSGL